MNIHFRIRQRRKELGLSQPALAKLVGVSPQTVSLWEQMDGTAPGRERLKVVADVLKTTVEWLTTGNDANLETNGNYAFIPRLLGAIEKGGSVQYHQEIGDFNDANDTYAYRKDYLASIGVQGADCRVAITHDDSMRLGSQLLVDTADRRLVANKVYAFDTPHGLLVRRVFLLTNGNVELHADNPAMRLETCTTEGLPPVLGRVVAFQGTLA
jgi:transcriptional regulator with XRE-family HTH domain